jgi:hypothetical protein
MLMRPKHPLDRLLTLKASGVHDLMGSITAHPAEEMHGELGMPGARRSHELFIPSLPPAGLKVGAGIPDQDGMIIVIAWRTRSLAHVWSEYGRSYSICLKV